MNFEKKRMKNITIALPAIYVANLEKLRDMGITASRSEGIRLAIKNLLVKEAQTYALMEVSK
ncbi:ribbon-helix-helix protein, CopG family [Candidatus Harpocratesius sp.]